jgi:hypothetical protein
MAEVGFDRARKAIENAEGVAQAASDSFSA